MNQCGNEPIERTVDVANDQIVFEDCNSKPEYQGQSTIFYTCTNDGGGAPLVGVMIIASIAMLFGLMLGVSLARLI